MKHERNNTVLDTVDTPETIYKKRAKAVWCLIECGMDIFHYVAHIYGSRWLKCHCDANRFTNSCFVYL